MKISADQLDTHLKQRLLPLYFVTGDEPLLVAEALDSIRSCARESGFSDRQVYTAERGFDWNHLLTGSASLSLFAEKRIIDLRIPTGKPGDGAAVLSELAADPPADTLLLVSAPKLDKSQLSSKWVKSLEKAGALVQVWPVRAGDLPGWIGRRMRRLGMEPTGDVVKLLADRVEGNLLAAAQELEKLRLVCGTGRLDAGEVESAVADSARFNVFKLSDSAVAGHADRALRILGSLRAEGVEPVLILWALTREIRTACLVRSDLDRGRPLAKSLRQRGVWSSRENLMRACVTRHTGPSLDALIERAARADQVVKGRRQGQPWQEIIALTTGLAAGPSPSRAA